MIGRLAFVELGGRSTTSLSVVDFLLERSTVSWIVIDVEVKSNFSTLSSTDILHCTVSITMESKSCV